MKEVFITPDGGKTLHRFNLSTTLDAVIIRLESELEIEGSESEHWMIAFGRSKMTNWNNYKDVRNLMLRKYLELYPISEFQKIDGAIPLYLIDTSYHIHVSSTDRRDEYTAIGTDTLRDIIESPYVQDFFQPPLGEKPEYILQGAIRISEKIIDIPLQELCISRKIEIQVVYEAYV